MVIKEKLFQAVSELHSKLNAAYEHHDIMMGQLKHINDPKCYEQEKQRADNQLHSAIATCSTEAFEQLNAVLDKVDSILSKACMLGISNEQLSVLQLAQMHKRPTQDFLLLAGRSLCNSSEALEVLQSIAKAKGASWPAELDKYFYTFSDAQQVAGNLKSKISAIFTVNDSNVTTKLLPADFYYEDADQCFESFTGVDRETAQKFFDFCSCHTNLRSMY